MHYINTTTISKSPQLHHKLIQKMTHRERERERRHLASSKPTACGGRWRHGGVAAAERLRTAYCCGECEERAGRPE